ncbi:hypothetical protein [Arthrobacter sp. ok362]|uniref:DUF7793 family protein n=1 Tax=Arthrobacter sp. ok362 TaxID=1761745 RepID=UPI0008905DA2|nr:hypothetical protein [Arthrobacter sp. ok362]SDK46175.1 hypothetical protein SAMN04487913_101308 [Arthrobacter sp. ok362]
MVEIALTCANTTLDVDAEGTFHLRWTPGTTVSAADAESVVAAVQAVTSTSLQPMVVEITDVCMSPGARVTLLGQRFVSAVALVGATVVDRVMAAALLRAQDCPHGYFTSVDDAREWLSQLPVPDAFDGFSVQLAAVIGPNPANDVLLQRSICDAGRPPPSQFGSWVSGFRSTAENRTL